MQHLRYHVGERDSGADLLVGCLPQQRLDRGQVCQDPDGVASCLAVAVPRPGGQPLKHDVGRSAEQDDHVEAGVKANLVLLAPGDEHDLRVLGVQESRDRVFPPPLPAVRQRLAPAVIGVDGLVPERSELPDQAGLPGARHAG
jgi:hypothetical protein